jgi:hypothetical protein
VILSNVIAGPSARLCRLSVDPGPRSIRPTIVFAALPRKHRAQPRCYVAGEAFQAGGHLVWLHAGWHAPGDEVGQAVFADEGGELRDAFVDGADDPGLRDAGFLGDAGDAAVAAGGLTELAVNGHAAAFAIAHRWPVTGFVVGDQTGFDDADAVVRRVAAGVGQRLAPGVEAAGARALRQQVGVEAGSAGGAGGGHGGDP